MLLTPKIWKDGATIGNIMDSYHGNTHAKRQSYYNSIQFDVWQTRGVLKILLKLLRRIRKVITGY